MITASTQESLKSKKWYKIWAGNWSLLSISHFADQYTEILDLEGVKFTKHCVLVYRDGASSGFIPASTFSCVCISICERISSSMRASSFSF